MVISLWIMALFDISFKNFLKGNIKCLSYVRPVLMYTCLMPGMRFEFQLFSCSIGKIIPEVGLQLPFRWGNSVVNSVFIRMLVSRRLSRSLPIAFETYAYKYGSNHSNYPKGSSTRVSEDATLSEHIGV
jgi:hypothetical protein